jgi:hypothetical protein
VSDKIRGTVQRIIVTLYVLGVLLCCVHVPWRASFRAEEWFLGYSKFWAPPAPPFDPIYEARKEWPHKDIFDRIQEAAPKELPGDFFSRQRESQEKEQKGGSPTTIPSFEEFKKQLQHEKDSHPNYWTDEELETRLQNPAEFRKFVPGASNWSDRKIHSTLERYYAMRLIPPYVFGAEHIDYARIGLEVFCLTLLFGLALYLLRPLR